MGARAKAMREKSGKSVVKAERHPGPEDFDNSTATVVRRGPRLPAPRLGLAHFRKANEQTQASLATTLGVTQGALSALESGEDWKVSTLRAYAEALGFELEVCFTRDGVRY